MEAVVRAENKEEAAFAQIGASNSDLAHSKSAVLNSLGSESSHRTYDYAIDTFVDWYCSEPRLAFNRTVVLRYRIHLEQLRYAPSTINLDLAAVRRLAFEGAETGLLSPELAAGIARVKGVKRLGLRMGNGFRPPKARAWLIVIRQTPPAACETERWVPF